MTPDSVISTVLQRNADFVDRHFDPRLRIMPSMKTMVLGCVDPRVDPADVLGLRLGEAAIIRNVGGRVVPAVIETMAMLGQVSKAGGGALGSGWHFIVLHHTDCGITRITHATDLLSSYFGVAPAELEKLAITDPRASVALDVAALKASPAMPAGFLVTGLVYDVATGKLETVVSPQE